MIYNIEEEQGIELSSVITDIAAGPFGSNLKVSCFVPDGFPIIDGANLKGFKVTDNVTKFVTDEKAHSLERSIAHRGDVISTISGTLGQIAYIPGDSKYEGYLCSQRQFRITFNKEKVYVPYIVFYFHTREGQHKIMSFASQVGVPALAQPLKNFRKIKIHLPDIETQKRIASIIEVINNKIEKNEQINDNLLQQALCLYESLIENKEKQGCIGDYCSIKSGFAFKSKWWQASGIPVVKIGSINQDKLDLSCCSYVSADRISYAEDFIVSGGDLLIAMTGATLGKFAMVPKVCEPILVNQRVGRFFIGDNPVKRLPFIYCTLKQPAVISEIINRGQGSAQPNISASDIMSIPCIVPENRFIDIFNQNTSPMFEKIIHNQHENEILASIRNMLLPKLMSGEIDVSQIAI